MSARGVEGAPLVLVEILSPSRPAYDRLTKATRYAACGVTHFWIVDPDARSELEAAGRLKPAAPGAQTSISSASSARSMMNLKREAGSFPISSLNTRSVRI